MEIGELCVKEDRGNRGVSPVFIHIDITSFKKRFTYFCAICMGVLHTCMSDLSTMCAKARRGCQIPWNSSYRQFLAATWVMRTQSSVRVHSTLYHQVISQALDVAYF